MTRATRTPQAAVLRPATDADVDAISGIWHRGWRDAHLGHVPDSLHRHRRLADFRALVPARVGRTTVATTGLGVVGFVTVHDDEVEQLYVDAPARGTGVAAALLAEAERAIGARFELAWLAVVAGNLRARRFYERNGWSDGGPFDYAAPTPAGTTVAVPARRYQKRLAPAGRARAE
jgi:GNAT superfamily N-acetyltransferase